MSELSRPHLDDFTLLRYTAGDLNDFERRTATRHLEACAVCSSVLREIDQLDRELKVLTADREACREWELTDLPPGDPFRSRPEMPSRDASLGTAHAGNLAARALAASERAAGDSLRILDAARESQKSLVALLATLSLSETADRFALLYALQESGRQIAESPVRSLILAEEVLSHLRHARPASPAAAEAERVVPVMSVFGQAHLLAGQACVWTGEFEKARIHFQLAYRAFGRVGDEVSLASVEYHESERRSFTGQGKEGLLLARRAAATFESLGLEDSLARAQVTEGLALFDIGRQEEALGAYRLALPVFEKRKLWSNYVGALNSIGTSLLKVGRINEARREYARALKRFSREQHRSFLAFIRQGLAEILFSAGRYREAATSLAQAIRLYGQCGLFANSLTASLFEIESWARSGDLVRARHRLEIFRAEVARHSALDPSVARQIEEALSGANPDFERIAELRQQAERLLQERLRAVPA